MASAAPLRDRRHRSAGLWERTKKADGQVVLLSGEPGIGISRMAAALAERLVEEPHYHLRYFCARHHQGTVPLSGHNADRARGEVRATIPRRRSWKSSGSCSDKDVSAKPGC
jgi:hypothetical protein